MEKYDPSVKYGWDKDAKFELSGNEFGLLLNTLRTILQSPEAQRILILSEANKAIETVLSRNVETGMVIPVKTKEKISASSKLQVVETAETEDKK